jgi:hypothetical protein
MSDDERGKAFVESSKETIKKIQEQVAFSATAEHSGVEFDRDGLDLETITITKKAYMSQFSHIQACSKEVRSVMEQQLESNWSQLVAISTKPASFTMPSEEEIKAQCHNQPTQSHPKEWAWDCGFWACSRWLRDRIRPVTASRLSDDELATLWAHGEKHFLCQFEAFEDGYRACEARLLERKRNEP